MAQVLIDSSIWIDHLRRSNDGLAELLLTGRVLIHSSIIGELACGGLKQRFKVLSELLKLPRVLETRFEETLEFVEAHHLWGQGLSWIDIQLLASCLLTNSILWTKDRQLFLASEQLKLNYNPNQKYLKFRQNLQNSQN